MAATPCSHVVACADEFDSKRSTHVGHARTALTDERCESGLISAVLEMARYLAQMNDLATCKT